MAIAAKRNQTSIAAHAEISPTAEVAVAAEAAAGERAPDARFRRAIIGSAGEVALHAALVRAAVPVADVAVRASTREARAV